MSDWKQKYAKKIMSAADALKQVKDGDRVVVGHACGEPPTLVEALVARAPELKGVETFFIDHQRYINGIVVVTELRRMPDGSFNKLNLLVANTPSGWRVLNEVDDSEIQGEVD
jgi:hypothetical protein